MKRTPVVHAQGRQSRRWHEQLWRKQASQSSLNRAAAEKRPQAERRQNSPLLRRATARGSRGTRR